MSVGFIGIGSALPPRVRENDFWQGKLGVRDESEKRRDLLAVERTTRGERTTMAPEIAEAIAELKDESPFKGAKRRRVVEPGTPSSDLEAQALEAAIADARIDRERIQLVLVSSILPDCINPMNGPALQQKCRLSNAAAWSVEAACASLQAQLVMAAGLIESGMYETIAIVQSQVASPILDHSDPVSPGFGDGAAAAIVSRVPNGYGLLGQYAKTDGSLRDGIVFLPANDAAPHAAWWETTDLPWSIRSFDKDVAKQSGLRAVEFCREASFGALRSAGKDIGDVDFYLGNQSVAWFVGACRRSLGIPAHRAVDTFPEIANIGAAAVLHNLDVLRRSNRLEDGNHILMYSPAAGFTRSAVVYRWSEQRP